MYIIKKDKNTQDIVLIVNIDSPRKNHVKTGKTRYDKPKAINRTDHNCSLSAMYAYFDAIRQINVVGIAKRMLTNIACR